MTTIALVQTIASILFVVLLIALVLLLTRNIKRFVDLKNNKTMDNKIEKKLLNENRLRN